MWPKPELWDMYKATSIYWGEIAQTPIAPTSILIIRGGLEAFKTGPLPSPALSCIPLGGDQLGHVKT